MNKLIVSTRYPVTVAALLKSYQLVECVPSLHMIGVTNLELDYGDDAISQSLAFWFALAEGCGLVSDYQFVTAWMEREREEACKKSHGI